MRTGEKQGKKRIKQIKQLREGVREKRKGEKRGEEKEKERKGKERKGKGKGGSREKRKKDTKSKKSDGLGSGFHTLDKAHA